MQPKTGVSQSVVVHCKQTVLLVPDEFALTDAIVPMSVSHNPGGVYIFFFIILDIVFGVVGIADTRQTVVVIGVGYLLSFLRHRPHGGKRGMGIT